jgi:hypothetical protein
MVQIYSWEILGVYFGYPSCCIQWFVENHSEKLTLCQKMTHRGFGFIPCPKCSRELLLGKITYESLLKDRICETKFPESDF